MISTVNSADQSGKLALDTNSLSNLKQSAKAGSPEALRGAATQFEAMFINMMMKSMRDATPQEGMTDSETTKTFTTMLDTQTSQNLAKRGMGLADMLVRQMSTQTANAQALAIGGDMAARLPDGMDGTKTLSSPTTFNSALSGAKIPASPTSTGNASQAPHVRSFQEKLAADADEASAATGIPAKFMLGQAALESGWGKREIKNADGSTSHNLFGIKAGPGWTGKTTTAVTTEYVNGAPVTRREKFRAYDSYADSFKDYAKLIANNPRYEKVMNSGGDAAAFAQGLQKAGYATDPHYATKLTRIIKNTLA
ncbi:MAG: flagellar assembly peptidoglycan hydrolase FlgJ [Pseudomonadota bacterium]|nr:flagellar assembly peptidoglycan hydrolase FlgJ [Pseudomonadota bacterium]